MDFCGETQKGVAGVGGCNFQRGMNQTRMKLWIGIAYTKKKITLSPEQVYLLVPSVIPSSIYSIEPKIQSSEVWIKHRIVHFKRDIWQ